MVNLKTNEKYLHLRCDCSGEAIEFAYYPDWKQLEVCLWIRGYQKPTMGFLERIRWCWRILRTGQPWTDMVILSHEQISQVQGFLKQIPTHE